VVLYVSLGLNLLLLVALVILVIKYLKLRREDREFEEGIRNALTPTVDRFAGRVGPFSLGSFENLLANDDENQPLLQGATFRAGFQTTSSNQSSVSDDTFLRHRSEYMFMKTFKPEAEKSKQKPISESTV